MARRKRKRRSGVTQKKITMIKAVLDHGRLPHGYQIVKRKRRRKRARR